MANDRIVKYAGFSRVVNEKQEVSFNFHVSNNVKYAVWAALPETELGNGKSVTFYWFKMPANTSKLDAIKTLLGFKVVTNDDRATAFLNGILTKATPKVRVPKVKTPKAAKQPKAKAEKVVVTAKDTPKPTLHGIEKIRAAAEAFKNKKASKVA